MTVTAQAGLFALRHAADRVEGFVEAKLSSIGLSVAKLAALSRLVEAGGSLPLGQLAERLACVKSNVTQLVDRLEADGLVSRALDPSDRRSRLAVITPAGSASYEQGARLFDEAERQIFNAMSDEESVRLAEILSKLSSQM